MSNIMQLVECGEVVSNRGSTKGQRVYAFKCCGILWTTNKRRTRFYRFNDKGWTQESSYMKWLLLLTFWKLKGFK